MFTNNVIKKREEHLKIFWHIHLVSTLAKILKTGEFKNFGNWSIQFFKIKKEQILPGHVFKEFNCWRSY